MSSLQDTDVQLQAQPSAMISVTESWCSWRMRWLFSQFFYSETRSCMESWNCLSWKSF